MSEKLPSLIHSLQNKDQGFLRILCELWGSPKVEGIPATGKASEVLLQQIDDLVEGRRLMELVEALSSDSRLALDDLLRNAGKLPWALFSRRYGAVREMGAGKRDRVRPHLEPVSSAEVLWYRGLVMRAFLDTPDGPQEFAYIPGDLIDLIPGHKGEPTSSPGRAASPSERLLILPSDDHILDHTCTLLSALRMGLPLDSPEFTNAQWDLSEESPLTPQRLQAVLSAAEVIDSVTGLPLVEATRRLLELTRGEALALLARSWQHSTSFNDLHLLPGLGFEGEWHNDPLGTRTAILKILRDVPPKTWWSLSSFTAAVKQKQPDFQRPSGDYDSWFIRDQATGEYLRGFEHWEQVDGALVRFLVCGPLHWLGILDLAAPESGAPPSAFRVSPWGDALLKGAEPSGLEAEEGSFLLSSDARVRVPRLAPRAARYQLARFCVWEGARENGYSYRLTAASLNRASKNGLRVGHLLTLLSRYALQVPPSLAHALERWEENGSEASLKHALVLRVRTPEMLLSLIKSSAARYLGDPLGSTAIMVKAGAADKVLAALAEMGYMGEIQDEL